ncbi:MAG: hypothetical protein HOC23_19480 [Halieaceae bacterium]|nr:hypothetical protein [Halieaceae bacterium]
MSRHTTALIAGSLWNLVFGGLGVLNLPLLIELFYHSVPSQAQITANQGFWMAVAIFGIGYGVVGLTISKLRFFVSLGAIGKFVFFLFMAHLWLVDVATNFAAVIAVGDLLWGLYFLVFIFRTREYGYL